MNSSVVLVFFVPSQVHSALLPAVVGQCLRQSQIFFFSPIKLIWKFLRLIKNVWRGRKPYKDHPRKNKSSSDCETVPTNEKLHKPGEEIPEAAANSLQNWLQQCTPVQFIIPFVSFVSVTFGAPVHLRTWHIEHSFDLIQHSVCLWCNNACGNSMWMEVNKSFPHWSHRSIKWIALFIFLLLFFLFFCELEKILWTLLRISLCFFFVRSVFVIGAFKVESAWSSSTSTYLVPLLHSFIAWHKFQFWSGNANIYVNNNVLLFSQCTRVISCSRKHVRSLVANKTCTKKEKKENNHIISAAQKSKSERKKRRRKSKKENVEKYWLCRVACQTY